MQLCLRTLQRRGAYLRCVGAVVVGVVAVVDVDVVVVVVLALFRGWR